MSVKDLTEDELEEGLIRLAGAERADCADLLEHLLEFDERRTWEKKRWPSLFRYCVIKLALSPGQAFRRIQVARHGKRFPAIFDMLRQGQTTLEAAYILTPHLNEENAARLLEEAKSKTNVEIGLMVAALSPRPAPVREVVRALPSPASVEPQSAPAVLSLNPEAPANAGLKMTEALMPFGAGAAGAGAERIEAYSPDRIRLGLTVSRKAYDALQRIKGLLWHKKPSSRLEDALEEAAEFYLQKKDPARKAARKKATRRGRAPVHALVESRRIPQWVKDEVWARDEGRCACLTADGSRCPETTGLEYDHIVPWALGGRSQDPKNIRLACRAHNQQLARQAFGRLATARRSSSRGG